LTKLQHLPIDRSSLRSGVAEQLRLTDFEITLVGNIDYRDRQRRRNSDSVEVSSLHHQAPTQLLPWALPTDAAHQQTASGIVLALLRYI
jgi:hypothetical protein